MTKGPCSFILPSSKISGRASKWSALCFTAPRAARFPHHKTQEARRASAGLNDMAARGRAPGFKMPDEHRTKIANSRILKRLILFAEGGEDNGAKVEMSPHQVTASLGLLRKVLPDLSNVEMKGAGENGEFVMRFRFE